MYEILKQDKNEPMPVEQQAVAIWLGTKGYTEEIELSEVKRFEWEFLSLLRAEKSGLIDDIKNKKEITDSTDKKLQAFAQDFIKIFSKKE